MGACLALFGHAAQTCIYTTSSLQPLTHPFLELWLLVYLPQPCLPSPWNQGSIAAIGALGLEQLLWTYFVPSYLSFGLGRKMASFQPD